MIIVKPFSFRVEIISINLTRSCWLKPAAGSSNIKSLGLPQIAVANINFFFSKKGKFLEIVFLNPLSPSKERELTMEIFFSSLEILKFE